MKILLIDNYDSFTYNLFHYLSSLKCKVEVYRNDKISLSKIKKNKYKKIVISPGPGNPNQAGSCIDIVKKFYKTIPILGVCLGHQVIGQVFNSKIIEAKKLMHGKTSLIRSKKLGVLKGIESKFTATRYHSLIVDRANLSKQLSPSRSARDARVGAAALPSAHVQGRLGAQLRCARSSSSSALRFDPIATAAAATGTCCAKRRRWRHGRRRGSVSYTHLTLPTNREV